MSARGGRSEARPMTRYLLHHSHEPHECGVVYASFRGHRSPLRHQQTLASCRSGGHAIWWTVEAASEEDALGLLPWYVAERTTATSVSADGISVRLLWHPRENAVTVSVEDARVGDRFQLAVAPDRALEAFYHPFAHAA
jgi:hypothetical protein